MLELGDQVNVLFTESGFMVCVDLVFCFFPSFSIASFIISRAFVLVSNSSSAKTARIVRYPATIVKEYVINIFCATLIAIVMYAISLIS